MKLALIFFAVASARSADVPPEVKTIVELAHSAPPEIFANTVLALAETSAISAGPAQTDLLEQAFAAAAQAHEPVRLFAMPSLGADTPPTFRARAATFGLDALSLQSRALQLLAIADRRKALELFQNLRRPNFDRRPCGDPLLADPTAYYEMADAVFKSSGQNVQLLQGVLAGLRSPAELAPAAHFLLTVNLKPEEMELLLTTFASNMGNTAPDFRSFTSTVDDLRASLVLLAAHGSNRAVSAQVLAEGFRHLVTSQLSAARCDGDFGGGMNAAAWFNAATTFRGVLPPISPQEIQSSQRLGGFQAASYFDSPDANRLWEMLGFLRLNPGLGPRPEAERATAAWLSQAENFLREYSAWTPSGSSVDVLHKRMTLLDGLVLLAPAGDTRDRTLAEAVRVLSTGSVEREAPAEWFYEVKALVDSIGPDKSKLMETFRQSGDVSLTLFAETPH